jgi:hypothetical protein
MVDILMVSPVGNYEDSAKATITTTEEGEAILRSLASQSNIRVTSNIMSCVNKVETRKWRRVIRDDNKRYRG